MTKGKKGMKLRPFPYQTILPIRSKVIIHKSCVEQFLWNRNWTAFGPVGNTEKRIGLIMSNF